MKLYFSIIAILTLGGYSVEAQTGNSKNQNKTEYKNQGEQEDYWAKDIFETKYSKKHFDTFKGDITIDGDRLIFGDHFLVILNTPKELKAIFLRGIFYPTLITGDATNVAKSQKEVDSLSAGQKVFYNMTGTDSLTISNLKELTFLSKSPKYRRFKFWLWQKGFANPTACFMELTNERATDKTKITDFIFGASLTFFYKGWVGI